MFRLANLGTVQEASTYERLLLALAMAFVAVNALALSIALEGRVTVQHLWSPLAWFAVMIGCHVVLHRLKPGRDPFLLPLYALLTGWGLILVDRLAPNFLPRQTLWLAISAPVAIAIAVFPRNLRLLRRYRYSWLTLGLILLLATLAFGVNPSGSGPTLWLAIPLAPDIYFQPSELLKLVLIVFLASYFDEYEYLPHLGAAQSRRASLAFLLPLLLMWGLSILLLVWQRDLGAAILFFLTFLSLLFVATGRWTYVVGGIVLTVIAAAVGYFIFPLVALRIDAWVNPWPEVTGRAFQIAQSLYAIAAGGVTGQGVGQGFPYYIPVVHSDFAFAAIAEEWGLVGSLSVVLAFVLLIQRGIRIATDVRRSFHAYLALGVSMLLATQSFLIMAGVTKLLPLTGVTLPFISYGGSSLLISSVMLGLLLWLSTRKRSRP
jgi:cell division protein FtsW (lipid II flippase)